jgi:hypothetical protein
MQVVFNVLAEYGNYWRNIKMRQSGTSNKGSVQCIMFNGDVASGPGYPLPCPHNRKVGCVFEKFHIIVKIPVFVFGAEVLVRPRH